VSRILHVSDLHFGWPAILEQAEAVEALPLSEHFDIVVVSGDLSQRARAGELQRAAVFLRNVQRAPSGMRVPALITVPGNHDVAWWFAPLGLGNRSLLYAKYRRYIAEDLEPVVRIPGATFVGLNTAAGVDWHTLTWNPRDLSITGGLRKEQLSRAAEKFTTVPAGEARIVVMHHNPVRGELSHRFGLVRSERAMDAFREMGVDLIMCGHDHQEAIHPVEKASDGPLVVTAGTISSRSRGGRPSAINVVTMTSTTIEVETRTWSSQQARFETKGSQCFER
jgi:3',5'-cyclic AMP phosphodiesterase CpdA